MKKYISLLTVALLVAAMLTGCMGTPVVVQDCTCPSEGNPTPTEPSVPGAEGAVKTGLALITSASGSASADGETDGEVSFDNTLVAVTVDDAGVINSCVIDSIPATVSFDNSGAITSDYLEPVATKNELGADYGMVSWGGAIAEWDEQVAALANFAVGKTVAELKNGAIDESGRAPEGSDLASSATIYLGNYVSAIEAAVNNAQHLGADAEDELRLVTMNKLSSSADATADAEGCVQLDADVAVVTSKDGVITSCIIDSVQAKVNFDTTGTITTDLSNEFLSKNQLGESYGMVSWGGAIAEWNVQAASFASYVTGKTADEVAGIAINEATKPADGSDLASSVTISIGGFQALIAKAFAE